MVQRVDYYIQWALDFLALFSAGCLSFLTATADVVSDEALSGFLD